MTTLAVSASHRLSCALRAGELVATAGTSPGERTDLTTLVHDLCSGHGVQPADIAELRIDIGTFITHGLDIELIELAIALFLRLFTAEHRAHRPEFLPLIVKQAVRDSGPHHAGRRLGPQRTQRALEAIASQDWATACRAMLDYYDRCYDHELERAEERRSIDLTGLDPEQSADQLLRDQLISPLPEPTDGVHL